MHLARGEALVNGEVLREGDGAAITAEAAVEVKGTTGGEVLLFDLA